MSRENNPVKRSRFLQSILRTAGVVYAGRRKVATGMVAVLAVALGYHVVFGHNGLIVYKQKRDETVILDQQLEKLRLENEQLKDHTARLQNDPNAIEHQAREELHYTRPGEVIYTMPLTSHPAGKPQK